MTKENIFLLVSIPIYVIAILFENYLSYKQNKQLYDWKDSGVSIWLGVGGALMDIVFKGICFLVLDWCNQQAIFQPDLLNHYPILAWCIVFVGQDFCFYWLHRTEHTSRFFWAVHSNHHSSEKYNFTVALRSSVLQPMYRFIFYIPVAFLGFDGMTIMFMYAVNQFYQFFLHTQTIGKLPLWFEAVFVTPSHHRVHHASDIKYLDKNMGQVLIIWDKLFGTFQKEEELPTYGLTKNINSYNPIKVFLAEWFKIASDLKKPNLKLVDMIRYIFAAPGWSHDGSSKTSEQLRKTN